MLFVLSCVDVHHQQVTGLDVVQVVQFQQSLQVGQQYWCWCFAADVGEAGDEVADVVGVQRVPLDEIVHHCQRVVRGVQVADVLEKVSQVTVQSQTRYFWLLSQ